MEENEFQKVMSQFNGTKERLSVEKIKEFPEVTYRNYIRTDELLSLQSSEFKGGLHHHDEHLFIVVHQSMELWFKQTLWELDSIRKIFRDLSTHKYDQEAAEIICHRLRRADSILRFCLGAFDILETMNPADFLEFRDYIGPASGFQSVQLRELEICLGLKDEERILLGGSKYTEQIKSDKKGLERIKRRLKEPSLKDIVYKWLEDFYERVPDEFESIFKKAKKENLIFQKSIWFSDEKELNEAVDKEYNLLEPYLNGETSDKQSKDDQERCRKRRIALLYIMCYRQNNEISRFANAIDLIVAFEEGLLLWRQRHVRMVERMIGRRIGTGGSTGVSYLEQTMQYRIFRDLWEVRTHFIRSTALPYLELKK